MTMQPIEIGANRDGLIEEGQACSRVPTLKGDDAAQAEGFGIIRVIGEDALITRFRRVERACLMQVQSGFQGAHEARRCIRL